MCGCGSNFDGKTESHFSSVDSINKRRNEMKGKISSFTGSSNKGNDFIDVRKYGIDEEEHFAYNPKQGIGFTNFSDGRGFKHNNELGEYDY